MLIEIWIGRYAGDIVDVRADVAKRMLEDGRAGLPNVKLSKPKPQVPAPKRRGRPPKKMR